MPDFQATGRASLRIQHFLAICLLLVLLAGCKGEFSSGKAEYVYVAVPEAALRDRVATIYNKTGTVRNGERLQVIERMQNRRFVRVRTSRGEEGWLQERYLASQQTFDEFQRLVEQFKDAPSQGSASVERPANLHAQPGRKTEHLYQLQEKQKVELLERRPVDRNAPAAQPKDQESESDSSGSESSAEETPTKGVPTVWDDWWLVRDSNQHVGWVLGHGLYLDVPQDVAQYAEGQRIVAAFLLDEVEDEGKKVGEYLLLFTEPKDGMPYDFDQIRVFTWNVRKHRYETAYRERNLDGTLPVTLGRQEFEKEGNLRTFTLHVRDANGQPVQQTYKFNPPIVRKVYAPGQEPAPGSRRKPSSRAKKHRKSG
jgi:Bacterial SH3 domain